MDATTARIKRMHSAGAIAEDIAYIVGLSMDEVYEAIDSPGRPPRVVHPRRKTLGPAAVRCAREMWRSGEHPADIAAHLRCDEKLVWALFRA